MNLKWRGGRKESEGEWETFWEKSEKKEKRRWATHTLSYPQFTSLLSSYMPKKKFSNSLKLDLKSPKLSPPIKKEEQPKYVFGDLSVEKEENTQISEVDLLDKKLEQLQLIRKKIPKDGACMFRAISEQLFYSQAMHFKGIIFLIFHLMNLVRQKCVDFMILYKENFEPFVCVSGLPFDHYCFGRRIW